MEIDIHAHVRLFTVDGKHVVSVLSLVMPCLVAVQLLELQSARADDSKRDGKAISFGGAVRTPSYFFGMASRVLLFDPSHLLQRFLHFICEHSPGVGCSGLNNNRLEGTIPTELGKLKDLRMLYVNHNKLSGRLPLTELVNLAANGNATDSGERTNLRELYGSCT